jgi:hypothetical protein
MYQMPDSRDRLKSEESDVRTRVVIDGHGNEWTVHEVETPQPWAHARHCLIFNSSAVVRRVWSYPDGWARMSATDLLGLIQDDERRR